MTRLLQSYLRWRGDHPERRFSLIATLTLTLAALGAFTVQDLPVLNEADTLWIGTSLTLLAAGSIIACAGAAAGNSPVPLWSCVDGPIALAVGAMGLALGYYKLIGGVGSPGVLDLAAALVVVAFASSAGVAISRLGRRWRLPALALTIVLVSAGSLWLFNESGPLAGTYERDQQECTAREGVTYCTNPGYEKLVDLWAPVVQGVLDVAPEDGVPPLLPVVQEFDGPRPGDAMAVPSSRWGRGSGKGVAEVTLALDVADWVVGAPQEPIVSDPGEPVRPCDMAGQARAIVGMWIAGQVSADARRVVVDVAENDPAADTISGSYAESSNGGNPAARYASQLLARPDDQVMRVVHDGWTELVDPDTTYRDAWRILDLEPLPGDSGLPVPYDPKDPEAVAPPCR